jgi:Xaa-Pro aminopeptidase
MGPEGELTDEKARVEAVGQTYDVEMMLMARGKTRQAMHEIAAAIRPGLVEEEAMELARRTLKAAGLLRGWHGIHVRFGANTLKSFGVPSEPGVALQKDDIFFIDIGPVWQKWEGDAGDTFVVGHDPDMHRIARDVRTVFDRVHARWRADGLSGEALYRHASDVALSLGWELNLDMSGHRLADFPHAAIHRGALAATPFAPSPGLWVLEIQIRHPELPFSAFYEDLLLE